MTFLKLKKFTTIDNFVGGSWTSLIYKSRYWEILKILTKQKNSTKECKRFVERNWWRFLIGIVKVGRTHGQCYNIQEDKNRTQTPKKVMAKVRVKHNLLIRAEICYGGLTVNNLSYVSKFQKIRRTMTLTKTTVMHILLWLSSTALVVKSNSKDL